MRNTYSLQCVSNIYGKVYNGQRFNFLMTNIIAHNIRSRPSAAICKTILSFTFLITDMSSTTIHYKLSRS
jgi:hypothetical protein